LPKAAAVAELVVELVVGLVVELLVVVPGEALARAVLREQAAVRVLLPIRRPILEARPGAAPILRAWAIRTPTRIPGALT
jgi:hypothetical protein